MLCSCFIVFSVMDDDTTRLSRDELREIIAYALWRSLDLRPQKRSLDDARIWAKHIVDHLELCRVEWKKKPPLGPHSTH